MAGGKTSTEGKQRRSIPALLGLIAPLLILGAVFWSSVAGDLGLLVNGEIAVVTEVRRQAGDSSPSTEAPSAGAAWRFPDGRTGSGTVTGNRLAIGDEILAGAGWAHSSPGSLRLQVGMVGGLGLLTVLGSLGLGVLCLRGPARSARAETAIDQEEPR
ncbi:hypothetical protein [Kibdelosporangium phytohabitans]|uniref:Uncharacterized protein n=1 Tax=Kibdelosporangium phytohabitans TaxID=860235 RepID=A0A0N9I1M2_9PSEU|nr:hypothetical protein [Kibdelosporangium phytohabitans]ALG08329.1 hypothetical protein AOZ06_16695 [Kibdelosporangium phytohabitans]MBE1470638.1 hypothetical protein [Kibdelosporangium phytohabitans]